MRDRAERLLATHALTAADACQLAAARVRADGRPKLRPLVCRDTQFRADQHVGAEHAIQESAQRSFRLPIDVVDGTMVF